MLTQPLSSSHMTASQRAQTISELDERIHYHLQELRSLRRQRNNLASLTQYLLPAEILLSIFMIYQKRELLDLTSHSPTSSWSHGVRQRHHPPPYLVPSYVCVYWRRITLDFPPFWSVLFLKNTKLTKELLIRSKNFPLSLNLQIPSNFEESLLTVACLKMALPESYRFQSLSVSSSRSGSDSPSDWKGLAQALETAVRSLNRLCLKLGHSYDSHQWTAGSPPLLADHLGKKLPLSLHTLELYEVSPASLGLGFIPHHLTRLECRNILPKYRPSVSFYLSLMEKFASLEALVLDGALPFEPDREPLQSINHSSLKKLTLLGDDVSICVYAQFLGQLNLSPLVSLNLIGRCGPTPPVSFVISSWANPIEIASLSFEELQRELSPVILALQPYFGLPIDRLEGKTTAPFRSMVVESVSRGLNLAFSRENRVAIDKVYPMDARAPSWEYNNVDIELQLTNLSSTLRSNSDGPITPELDPSKVILELLQDIVRSVEHVVLVDSNDSHSGEGRPPLVLWIEEFSKSQTLKELDIRFLTSFHPLILSLDPRTVQQRNGEESSLSYPALQKMTVREILFARPAASSNSDVGPIFLASQGHLDFTFSHDSHTFFYPSPSGRDFPSVFKARKAAGHCLRVLSFCHCASFDTSVSPHYSGIVEKLEWDGLDSKFWNIWKPLYQAPFIPSDETPSDGLEEE